MVLPLKHSSNPLPSPAFISQNKFLTLWGGGSNLTGRYFYEVLCLRGPKLNLCFYQRKQFWFELIMGETATDISRNTSSSVFYA